MSFGWFRYAKMSYPEFGLADLDLNMFSLAESGLAELGLTE